MKRTMACLIVLFFGGTAWATGAYGADATAFYQTGKEAYNRADPDYLTAAKYLFAYLKVAEDQTDKDLIDAINDAITYSDEMIFQALRTKKELDEKGHVVEVVIETSGSADGYNSQKKNEKFQMPSGPQRFKPRLPTNVPQTGTGNQTETSGNVHLIKPIQTFNLSAQSDASAQTETFEKEIEELKLRNKSMANEYKEQKKAYEKLKDKYISLEEKCRALKDAQQ